jgi:2Fe-2S ferredoxin
VVEVTFIEADGTEHRVDGALGLSLMQAANHNGVPGILADCGGSCACGTCRVYVDPVWRARVGEPSEIEEATLEMHDDDAEGKRLSCQIQLDETLNGLVVHLPVSQFGSFRR